MKKSSFVTFILAACALLPVTFGCSSSSGSKPAENNPPSNSPANSAANTSTTKDSAMSDSSAGNSSLKISSKDISGSYSATGKNSDGGGDYTADLVVTNRDDVYQFSWNSKGKKYDGVGVQTDDKIAVSFTDGTNGKGCGVVLYKINPDSSLDGKAGYWGTNTRETEKATRTGGTDLEGAYDIAGKNPQGESYQGKLNVKKEGEGYKFTWSGANSFEGFGVKIGDTVSVGFGGEQCGFVAYQVKSDGTLDGKWGGSGSTEFGTEMAKKK